TPSRPSPSADRSSWIRPRDRPAPLLPLTDAFASPPLLLSRLLREPAERRDHPGAPTQPGFASTMTPAEASRRLSHPHTRRTLRGGRPPATTSPGHAVTALPAEPVGPPIVVLHA